MVIAPEVEALIPALACLPVALAITDRDGVVRWVNEKYCEWTGLAAEEMIGRSVEAEAGADSGVSVHRGRVAATGEAWQGVTVVECRDGARREVELSIAPIRGAEGEVSHMLWSCQLAAAPELLDSVAESELRFQRMADAAPVLIWTAGLDSLCDYFNKPWLDFTGRTLEQELGNGWAEGVHPDDFQHCLDTYLASFQARTRFTMEYRLRRADGEYRWLLDNGVPRYSPSGRFEGFIGSCIDITDRKRTQEVAIQKSQEWHRNILQTAMDGYALVDLEGRLLEVNRAMCRMSGYSADELLTMRIADVEAVLTAEEIGAHIATVLERGVDRFETRHRRKDGTIIDVEVSVQPVPDHGNRMVAFLRDITDRKRAEQDAAESHDLLANLARLVPGVIYQYRLYPDGRSAFPYSSPGMNLIYEVTPEEVREDATPVFGRLHPEDYQRVADSILDSARTLETFYCEFRVILPRQGLRWRWSQAHPERMADGGTLWHGIISDITERKLAEAERENLTAQLIHAQKMESVGRLAGGVAHDFNNLLTVINGYSAMLLKQLNRSEPAWRYAEAIGTAGERAAGLTKQLLAFSRKQIMEPRILDVNATIRDCAPMLQRLIGEDISLSLSFDSELAPIKADPDQLHQIVMNLLVNARDAMPDGGNVSIETANVGLSTEECARIHANMPAGAYVTVSVTDTGQGIDEETLPKIWEPFFTTKEFGKGTGLGLSTVYGIVRQNEGWIDIWSKTGVGTCFAIYLPRHQGGAPERPAQVKTALTRGTETILLVEDQEAVRTLAAAVLRECGYHVIAAESGEAAIEIVEGHPGQIHLLVSDVVLPGMNGKELSLRLRQLQRTMRVLFISGYTADVIAHRGVLEAGVAYLAKPFGPEVLAAKVREVLAQSV
jgi:PAS domain S-box-containing protein